MYEFPGEGYCAKSVTVGLSTGAPLSLAQVEVWGTGEKGVELHDVALHKPCFQSSVACGGEPNRAVNGNDNNKWDTGNTTHTDPKQDNGMGWWYVELGAKYAISEVNIINRWECAERLDKAEVFVDEKHIGTVKYVKGLHVYHFPASGTVGGRVGVTLRTGKPLSLTSVFVMSDGRPQGAGPAPVPAPVPSGQFHFKTHKIGLLGAHGFFVCAEGNGKATCNRKVMQGWETFEVLPVRAGVISLKSCHKKYLSGQANHTLQWNRDKALAWEHFTVIGMGGDRIALKSHHGKYVQANKDGSLSARGESPQAWEIFTVHFR